ncbi:hypothetical protein ACP70R_017982 [Stipagrostis hirtigluma subsp. patula]
MEALVDRNVLLIDEVVELIQESGGWPSARVWRSIVGGDGTSIPFPAWLAGKERRDAERRAMRADELRYRTEIEAPAAAIVRERRAARPSAVRDKVVAIGGGDDAAAHYRAVLDGIEPDLSRLTRAPGVTAVALRLSSDEARAALHARNPVFVAGADHNILVLKVGAYDRGPGDLRSPGFYLVYDARASSLAAVPTLPPSMPSAGAPWDAHRSIADGVAVLRHGSPGDYVLADIFVRNDDYLDLPNDDDHRRGENKATLCTWRSSGGPDAGRRWTEKEVDLPFPSRLDEYGYAFCANTVFAVGSKCLCWVDLLKGILVCDDVPSLLAAAGADDDDVPASPLRFIPLPEGCDVSTHTYALREMPDPHADRAMCASGELIKFVCLDGYYHGAGSPEVTIATWTRRLSDPGWTKGAALRVRDLWADPSYADLRLPRLSPRLPVLSVAGDDDDVVVYLCMVDPNRRPGDCGGQFVFSVDVRRGKVLASSPSPDGAPIALRHLLATRFEFAQPVH